MTRRRARRLPSWAIPVALLLAGILVLLYPVVATQLNNSRQHSFAQQYQAQVAQAAPGDLQQALAAAHAYNTTLSGVPVLDPYLTKIQDGTQVSNEQYQAYLHQLDHFDSMARVRVPTAKIDLPVRHGTGEQALAEGAGHLYGTSLPVGGDGTHAVLTSHTGFTNATLFDHLNQVKPGDLMFVDVYGETLTYQVDNIQTVLPNEIQQLSAVPGKDLLTLFTCTPYGVNSHRLLVTGHRVPTPTAQQNKDVVPARSGFSLEWWMWLMLAGAALACLLAVLIVRRERRREQARTASHARLAAAGERAAPAAAGESSPRRLAPPG